MRILVAKNGRAIQDDYVLTQVNRSELTTLQEQAYCFAESMLKAGTDLLKIDARSRLATNRLCFCDLYAELSKP